MNYIVLQDALYSKQISIPEELDFHDVIHGSKLSTMNLYRWLVELYQKEQCATSPSKTKNISPDKLRIQHLSTMYYDDKGDLKSIEHKIQTPRPTPRQLKPPKVDEEPNLATIGLPSSKSTPIVVRGPKLPLKQTPNSDFDFDLLAQEEHQILRSLKALDAQLLAKRR